MEIIQIVAFALIAAFLSMVTREQKPIFSMIIATAAGVIIFLRVVGYLASVMQYLVDMTLQANISLIYLNTLLKVIGIAYIAEFGAQVCRDAGEGVIAGKVEFAAKLLILVMALPLLAAVLETILKFIP
ncbi:stage III sporulation protein AD [Dethiobacter alkaliphilus]|uniref:Stage III sporulation protein AD n=1 Tax=Dethiobacter alkaliphilus AHT 1 TaxID=555088 RepID=C0GE40_DETAL|nr:stage III sporulation protein AD [Dethiobacter alkaliphilus]EEG78334.1 stage III sporulation protein AD [Dethiobacter alkaliphilus AHT 1]